MRVSVLLLSVSILVLTGCADNPVKPKPTPSYYYFYGLDMLSSRKALRLDPATCTVDTVIDSQPRSYTFVVSAKGQYLYVLEGDSMVVYSVSSGQPVRSVPYHAVDAAASPDGRYVALLGTSYLGLTILGLPGYDVRYADAALNGGQGVFSRDSKTLYCLDAAQPDREVLRVRLEPTVSVERKAVPAMSGALIQVVPSIDERLLFLYSRLNWDACAFGVYDVAGDSILYDTAFQPGSGRIVVSPDGKNVFFTNGGDLQQGVLAPSAFYRYDIPTNTVEVISTRGLANDSTTGGDYLPIGPIAVTPDGQTVVGVRAVIGSDLIVYDIPNHAITKYCSFNSKPMFYDIHCQVGK